MDLRFFGTDHWQFTMFFRWCNVSLICQVPCVSLHWCLRVWRSTHFFQADGLHSVLHASGSESLSPERGRQWRHQLGSTQEGACCHTEPRGTQVSVWGACGGARSWSCPDLVTQTAMFCSVTCYSLYGPWTLKLFGGETHLVWDNCWDPVAWSSRSSGEHTWVAASSSMHECGCWGMSWACV